jgi:NodT family efflux transporter outer membrane factor (OMF) lipoprotein
MNKSGYSALLALCCTACSVGPDFQKPQIYSDEQIAQELHLNTAKPVVLSDNWYVYFHDEDLSRLIEQGLKNSPTVKKAIENLKQARYQLFIDRAAFGPTVDIAGKYDKSKQNLAGSLPVKSDYYQTGFDASWELDIWGGTRRLNESAQALLHAAAADLDAVRLTLQAEITSQYINYRLTERQIDLTKQNIKAQKAILQTVEQRLKSGLTDNLAFEQAKAVLEETQAQLPPLQTAKTSYLNALSVLVGVLPSEIQLSDHNFLDKEFRLHLKNLYNLPADVLRNRPDVRAAEWQLKAQNALIGKAVADMLPGVTLSGFLGYQNTTLAPLFAPEYSIYTLGSDIALPFIHWGALVNRVRLQESATRQAFDVYTATLLTAISDISNAMKTLEEDSKRHSFSTIAQQSNRQIMTLSLQKYTQGLIDFSQVMTAEQNLLSAEQTNLSTTAALYLDAVSFYKAVGQTPRTNRYNMAAD